jgi:hypothetical protein
MEWDSHSRPLLKGRVHQAAQAPGDLCEEIALSAVSGSSNCRSELLSDVGPVLYRLVLVQKAGTVPGTPDAHYEPALAMRPMLGGQGPG